MNITTPLRILVIEDEPLFAEHAQKQLREHSLTMADNFMDALQMLEEQQFDVVLTDLNFPLRRRYVNEENDESSERKPKPFGSTIAMEAVMRGVKKVGILTLLSIDHSFPVSKMAARVDLRIGDARILGRGDEWAPARDGGPMKLWLILLGKLLKD